MFDPWDMKGVGWDTKKDIPSLTIIMPAENDPDEEKVLHGPTFHFLNFYVTVSSEKTVS